MVQVELGLGRSSAWTEPTRTESIRALVVTPWLNRLPERFASCCGYRLVRMWSHRLAWRFSSPTPFVYIVDGNPRFMANPTPAIGFRLCTSFKLPLQSRKLSISELILLALTCHYRVTKVHGTHILLTSNRKLLLAFDVLFRIKSEQKVIGNWFCAPIIF